MSLASLALDDAISDLSQKWGNGALRWGSGGLVPHESRHEDRLAGGTAIAALRSPAVSPVPATPDGTLDGSVVPTGFPALDAILGPGGLPRATTATLKGDVSSGKTTLALRLCAEAQARGSVVAYLDASGTLDPVEAVARGVDLEWFVVLAPEHLDEGFAMAAALLQAWAVDLLVADLCGARVPAKAAQRGATANRADAIRRLAALARRSGALLVVLEPSNLGGRSGGALDRALVESSGVRLELARRDWIRLGREVVGQRVEVVVAKNRFGPPGRQVHLEILYADGADRDGCLARRDLLHPTAPFQEGSRDASPPSRLATSPASPGAAPHGTRLHVVAGRSGHPRRPAVGAGDRARREPRGTRLRGPQGVAARRSP